MHWHWLRFGFQLPKDLVLELTGKHSSCSEHISWEAIGIWLRIHFSGQRLMHQLPRTIIVPKMLRLRWQFGKLNIILKKNLKVFSWMFREGVRRSFYESFC